MHLAETLLADCSLAGVGVLLVLSAWRRLDHGPLLVRFLLGSLSTGAITVAIGALLLTLGRLPEPGNPRTTGQSKSIAMPNPSAIPVVVAPTIAARPAPPPEAAVSVPVPAVAPAPGEQTTPAAPAVTATAPEPPPASDRLTVFYATDRAPEPRAAWRYGHERGGRLEVGRAVVAVPGSPSLLGRFLGRGPDPGGSGATTGDKPAAASGLAILDVSPLAAAELQTRLKAARPPSPGRLRSHALLFIHGANMRFEDAVLRAGAIGRTLAFDGPVLVYSWPSSAPVSSYTWDRDSVRQATPHLKALLGQLRDADAGPLSIIAQGMGSAPLLAALSEGVAARPEATGTVPADTAGARGVLAIDEIILVMPDLDPTALKSLAGRSASLASRITLYASASDRALLISRAFHDGQPQAGDVPAGGPLVLPGIDTVDVTAAGADGLGLTPSGEGAGRWLLADIGRLLAKDRFERDAAGSRNERVRTISGDTYWRASRQ